MMIKSYIPLIVLLLRDITDISIGFDVIKEHVRLRTQRGRSARTSPPRSAIISGKVFLERHETVILMGMEEF